MANDSPSPVRASAQEQRLDEIEARLKVDAHGSFRGYFRSEEGHDVDVTAMYADLRYLLAEARGRQQAEQARDEALMVFFTDNGKHPPIPDEIPLADHAAQLLVALDDALDNEADHRRGERAALARVAALTQALKAIKAGLAADNVESGDFWEARKLLDKLGIYHENLSGTRVLLELARAALTGAQA